MKGELVTVAVTTYNCEDYVVETLESVFNQEYRDIELLISDDFSIDNTVRTVKDWLSQSRVEKRFSNIRFLTVEKNTGISANCNRCIKAASSDWVKFIAGDDILLPNCLSANMNFVNQNPGAQVIFSSVKIYEHTFEEKNFKGITPVEFPNNLMNPEFDAHDQWEILLESDRVHYTPSYFFNRKALASVGYYDETNKLVEDYPMWLKLTKSGTRLYFCNEVTVGYRKYKFLKEEENIENIFNSSLITGFKTRKKYAHPYLRWFVILEEYWVFGVSNIFQKLNINKKKYFYPLLYRLLTVYANPFLYLNALKRRFSRSPLFKKHLV